MAQISSDAREFDPIAAEVSEPHTDVVLLADSVRDLVQTRKREKAEKDRTIGPQLKWHRLFRVPGGHRATLGLGASRNELRLASLEFLAVGSLAIVGAAVSAVKAAFSQLRAYAGMLNK